MAFRTWAKLLLSALGVGALAGAGQLGFAYGLDIMRFARAFDAAAATRWTAQLVWVTWFATVAAVVGAVAGRRLARRHGHPAAGVGARLAFGGAAALGATAVAPLCMLPARAQVASGDPVLVTGLSAALGAVLGFFASVAALTHRAIGWNVAAITGGVWLLALVSVAPSLGPTDPPPAVRLGVLDPAWLSAGSAQRLALLTMPALALVAGTATGAVARWRGHPILAVASCGAVGPAMLALAYLTAGPGGAEATYQSAPYWAALLAAGAGALGSVLASVVRWPGSTGADEEAPAVEAIDVRHSVGSGHTGEGRSPQARVTTNGDRGSAEGTGVHDVDVPETPIAGHHRDIPHQRQSTHDHAAGPSTTHDAPGRRPLDRDLPRADSPGRGGREPDDFGPDDIGGDDPERGKAARADVGSGSTDPGTDGRGRRGIFRRGPAAKVTQPATGDAGSPAAEATGPRPATDRDQPAVPAREEEYVDWVSGLAAPHDPEPRDPPGPCSVRPTSRHHAE